MRRRILPLWLATLTLSVVSARGLDFVDDWALDETHFYAQPGAWESAISVSVLDGETSNVVRLSHSLIAGPAPSQPRPKPRPRLGGATSANDANESDDIYNFRGGSASRFLANITNRFYETWNSPLDSSEVRQWTHEIEAECVLNADKRSGVITVESVTDSPKTELMASLRKMINDTLGKQDGETRPFASKAVELDRLRRFVLSMSPFELPDTLTNLPGGKLRIRIAFRLSQSADASESDSSPAVDHGHAPVAAAELGTLSSRATTTPRAQQDTQEHENLLRHADINDPVYQFAIATRYDQADGLERNPALAAYWCQKAAEQGYGPAQARLGFVYEYGLGVDRDAAKALFWYGKAADQGDCTAIYNAGCMYANGNGVPRDTVEAARWDRRAAELGAPLCEWSLGRRYDEGDGLAQDLAEAFKWYLKAANHGYAYAQFKVGQMYESGNGISKDEIEALAWYNLAPTSGQPYQPNNRDRLEQKLGLQASQEARRRAGLLRQQVQTRDATSTR